MIGYAPRIPRHLLVVSALLGACGNAPSAPGSVAPGGSSSGGSMNGGAPGETSGTSSGGASAAMGGQPGGTSATGGASATGGNLSTGGASPNGGGAGTEAGSAGSSGVGGTNVVPYEPIAFGTKLDPAEQVMESQRLAQSLANPAASGWRAKGDQRRTYRFEEAATSVPYRVCVPTDWDGSSKLPLVMFLHGASNDESSYLDQNDKQMVKLAAEHGFLLVSPLGLDGAYGTFLRLPAVFGQQAEATKLLAMKTAASERAQERSEKDVINVLELVLAEYPVDRSAMFLTGHSMGSGGTWYIGGKYASYWAALAPMSGPFVLELGYPWSALQDRPIFVTEGTAAASLNGSRVLRDWMKAGNYRVTYEEVAADHAGMVPVVLPNVFAFFAELAK